jgi:sulfonate transport system permease protein
MSELPIARQPPSSRAFPLTGISWQRRMTWKKNAGDLDLANRRRRPSRMAVVILGLSLPVALLLLWDLSVRLGYVPDSILATPEQTVAAFIRLLANGSLLKNTVASGTRLLLGLICGLLVGIGLGLIVGVNRIAYRIVNFTISVLSPIPAIAFTPVLIVAFGIGDGSKIALVALGTFFIVYAGTLGGIRSTERKYIEVAQLLEKGTYEVIRYVLIPAATYFAIENLRVALALSWVLLLASELIASSSGLGWLIWDSRNFSRPDDMLVGMLTVGFLGKITDVLVVEIQKRALPWRDNYSV